MNFASFPYLCFLGMCILLYFTLRKSIRNIFLLLASYLFYSFFGLGFVGLMIFTTLVTFITARYCYSAQTKSAQLVYFFIGLLLDLAVFILFKYVHIIDVDILNWPAWSAQKLLIPIGISFYTFKTLGYCIDVYKRKYAPESSLVYYALSVSFFPQLIAGPIEKSHVIIQQLKQNSNFSTANFKEGGKLILWGFFKKIVIADTIALIINPVYSDIAKYGGLDLILVSIAFIFQVYADFSGYSDIAIGSAKCLGIELPYNFNKPFLSKNFSQFWVRWHATLSAWLREYIYVPLGGNRTSKFRWFFNLFFVFTLIGLWHGATYNYMAWALSAYMWVLMDILTKKFRIKLALKLHLKKRGHIIKIISYVSVVLMVAGIGVFFRADTLQQSFYVFEKMFCFGPSKLGLVNCLLILTCLAVLEFLQKFQAKPKGHCFELIKNTYVRISTYVVIIFAILVVSSRPDITFQYFQF